MINPVTKLTWIEVFIYLFVLKDLQGLETSQTGDSMFIATAMSNVSKSAAILFKNIVHTDVDVAKGI